ncbi:MAG: PASTA domain-containing protein, partial [Actinobacteria bacterium]
LGLLPGADGDKAIVVPGTPGSAARGGAAPASVGATVVVPGVVGLDIAKAGTALRAAGLAIGETIYARAEGKAAGTVLEQSPAGGEVAAAGSAVSVIVVLAEGANPNATSPPAAKKPSAGYTLVPLTPATPAGDSPNAPTAAFTMADTVWFTDVAHWRLVLDAGASTDDGTITTYTWTVSYGTTEETLSGKTVDKTWDGSSGGDVLPVWVRLTVTDDTGLTGTVTKNCDFSD